MAVAAAVAAAQRVPAPGFLAQGAGRVAFDARSWWHGPAGGLDRLLVVEIGSDLTTEDQLGPRDAWPPGLMGSVVDYLEAAGAASVVVAEPSETLAPGEGEALVRYPFDRASPARRAVEAMGGPVRGWPRSPLDFSVDALGAIEVRPFVEVLGEALQYQRLEARLDDPEAIPPSEARAFGLSDEELASGDPRARLGRRLERPDSSLAGRIVLVEPGGSRSLHAQATAQLLAGRRVLELPPLPGLVLGIEAGFALLGVLLPGLGGAALPVLLAGVASPSLASLLLLVWADLLIDPWGPTLALLLGAFLGPLVAALRRAGMTSPVLASATDPVRLGASFSPPTRLGGVAGRAAMDRGTERLAA